MKTLYLDIFSGISGDMFLGAMVDLGVSPGDLERELAKINCPGYHLHADKGIKMGIAGTRFNVHLETDHHHHPGAAVEHPEPEDHGHHHHHHHHESHLPEPNHAEHRDYAAIQRLISASSLSEWVRQKALAVFQRVAVAEGKIHGVAPEAVHFHEVGALDSIVDIVGACIALELLGKPRVLAGPLVEGTGWVKCAHGRYPLPVPATLEILSQRGAKIAQCEEAHELITPTGAAILAEFAETFAPMQHLQVERIGYGLGFRDNQTRPNVLRAVLGQTLPGTSAGHDWETDTVTVLESNLDDLSPEVLGWFMSQALAAGALDVFYTPIQMKKSRPGAMLTVLCAPAEADAFTHLILRETSAFGVRRYSAERRKLKRDFVTVTTHWGKIQVKLGRLNGVVVQVAPEYESCKAAAISTGAAIKEVYAAALEAYKKSL